MVDPTLVTLDREFRGNRVALRSPPTRFQLNLSELCNLRCAHCITFAPVRTEAGTARSMGPEVLAALLPHLRHATYVGLTHAGEPTIAPLFEPLLHGLKEVRAGLRTQVHVVSNGQILKPERFVAWSRMGVGSWSISLDGISAQTHDALRLGSQIDALWARLTALVAARKAEQLAVRLSLAFTLTAENLEELPTLVERAAALGVDALKVEEVVPVNPRASQLATVEHHRQVQAVEAARQQAWRLGLPLLDHLRPLQAWKCRLDQDPEMAERSLLDDYLNGAELNPCRLPWELICVEPNGDVRPVDFHHPVAGNLLVQDLLELWSAPAFTMARSAKIRARLCGPGPVTCGVDPGPGPPPRPLHFRYSTAPGQKVELLGDFPAWRQSHPMREVTPGHYERTLALHPGVYRYKLRVDERHWQTPPEAQIDRGEAHGNGLLVVDGLQDNLHFAPDAAHQRREGGTLKLHAEGEGELEWIVGPRRGRFQEVGQRGGLRLLRAEVPVQDDEHYGLVAPGQAPTRRFPVPAAAPDRPPGWAEQAVFYGIFVDRWHRGAASAPDPRASPRDRPSTPATYYGGDLYGVAESVPRLSALGVDVLLLTPIHRAESPHRYDAVDLAEIDPRLGGKDGLQVLLHTAHAHGLKVVLDAAYTHVSAAHPAFRSLLREQHRSAYCSWFRVRRWPVLAGDLSTYEAYANLPHLPKLLVESPAVEDHLVEAARALVELGVDGFRLDAMDEAPNSFWQNFQARLRPLNPELLFFGEVIHDRVSLHLGRGADVVTDFPRQSIFLEAFARGRLDAAQLWEALVFRAHRAGPFAPSQLLAFLDNHDTARFRSVAVEHDRLRLALAFLAAQPGPISLHYGTEAGLAGGGHDGDRDNVWCERLPMPPDEALQTRTARALTQLLALRRHPSLRAARHLERIRAEGPLLHLRRGGVQMAYNLGRTPVLSPVSGPVELLFDSHGVTDPAAPIAGLGTRWWRALLLPESTPKE